MKYSMIILLSFFTTYGLVGVTSVSAAPSKAECKKMAEPCYKAKFPPMLPVTSAWEAYIQCATDTPSPRSCENEAQTVREKWNEAAKHCELCYGMSSPLNDCEDQTPPYFIQCMPPLPPLSTGAGK